jgi:rhodanese-related sulfurtransferase
LLGSCSKASDGPTEPGTPTPAAIAPAAKATAATPTGATDKPSEAPLPFITTADLAARTARPPPWDFTLIDARSRVEFDDQHIDGAILVPAKSVTASLPAKVPNKDGLLVFYCNGPTCTKSQKAARAAIALGYRNVLEYNEGLPAWAQARQKITGHPLPTIDVPSLAPQALADAIKAKAVTVLDVRDRDEFETFAIAGSLNVPLDDIEQRAKELPAGSICVVDHSGHQTVIAGRLLASLGHPGAKRLDGGLLAWQRAGLAVQTAAQAQARP